MQKTLVDCVSLSLLHLQQVIDEINAVKNKNLKIDLLKEFAIIKNHNQKNYLDEEISFQGFGGYMKAAF